jgi:S1-C subfamily serine protease
VARTTTVIESPIVSTAASGQTHGLTVHQIYERDAPGVVSVSATGVSEGRSTSEVLKCEVSQRGPATGSGFEIGDSGAIITNWHVVDGATKITVGLEHGKTVEAQIAGKDPADDLAVLRIPTAGLTLHPLKLGDSSTAQIGDPVIAIGNPFGLERTLTTGVISALGRRISSPNGGTITGALQIDAPINPGNSGGPLLNERGEVIGINSQIETTGNGGSVGIAFAIPIDLVKRELSKLESG